MAARSGVTRAQFILSVGDQVEFINDLDTSTVSAPAGLYRVPLTKTFSVINKVTINPSIDLGTAQFSYAILDKSPLAGPQVRQNIDGVNTDTTVDIKVIGVKREGAALEAFILDTSTLDGPHVLG